MSVTLVRVDDWITDFMGNAVSGVQVFVASQPAVTTVIPPTPLAQLYSDEAGKNPINQVSPGGVTGGVYSASQQIVSDQNGHFGFYVAPGIYTYLYYGSMIGTDSQTLMFPDQSVNGVAPLPAQYNSDSTANGTITPAPDGVDRAFDLSQIPNPATSLVVAVNGVVQSGYTLVFATVSLTTAPHAGALITARYQVS